MATWIREVVMRPASVGKYQARLLVLLVWSTVGFGIQSVAAAASASPTASSAKKCKKGNKGKKCHKKAAKPAKAKIVLTNCPTADLTPNVPYTFTGRVVPARAGARIVMKYFDQGTVPLAQHTVVTANNGTFGDTFAYPSTGVRRGGTVRANSTTAIDPVCEVTISEM
jgi:hypothetical protein